VEQNLPKDCSRSLKNLVVAEAHDLDAKSSEPRVARPVLAPPRNVNRAIGFHGEGGFTTEEVHDEGPQGLLASEL
jgi:hypothetical protein